MVATDQDKHPSPGSVEQAVLAAIRKAGHAGITSQQLALQLGYKEKGRRYLVYDALEALQDKGSVKSGKKGRYHSARQRNEAEGTIDIIASGAGYVRIEGGREDVYVHARDVGMALHGDTVEVRNGDLYVNGALSPLPPMGQYAYTFDVKSGFSKKRLKEEFDVTTTDVDDRDPQHVEIPLTPERAERIGKFPNVTGMHRQMKERGHYKEGDGWPIFPNDPRYDWTEDNFGPLWVPKAGASVKLTVQNLPLYRRAIAVYEHNTVEVLGNDILINGTKADSYTFQQDYYWMMGDNRHRSQDARFWGFVPFDHVVGKAVLVWLTTDPERGGFPLGIRWKRLFSLVR